MDWILKRATEAQRETKYVEFKSRFDPTSLVEWLELIKDFVAMANSGGGVVLIGVNDNGSVSGKTVALVLALDSTAIADKVHKYTETNFSDFEIHEMTRDGKTIAAIRVGPSDIPIVFSQVGNYTDPGNPKGQKTAFNRGMLFFRHGARSSPGTTDDIRQALDRRIASIRKEWIGGVRKVVTAPSGSQVNVLPPEVVASNSPAATPIRVTDDPEAPQFHLVDPNTTHPFRGKDVVAELNKNLPKGRAVNQFDILCARQVHHVETRPDFIYRNIFHHAQYSQAFIDFLLNEYSRRKLPHQVDSCKVDSRGAVGLGRNVSGGTRPRLSWGRSRL